MAAVHRYAIRAKTEIAAPYFASVMPGLVPGIHDLNPDA